MKKTFVGFLFINLLIIITTLIIVNSTGEADVQQSEYHHWSSISITTEEQRRTESPNQTIQANEKYTPDITIKNYYPEKYLFRIFFLLDYEQVEVLHNGEFKTYIDMDLQSNSEESFQIEIPNMKNGLHDMVAIAVIEPDIPLDEKELSPAVSILMKRTPVIVANETIPSISYNEMDKLSTVRSEEFFVSNYPSVERQDSVSLVPYKKANEMWLNIPISNPNIKIAVFAILDTKQVIMQKPFLSSTTPGTIHLPLNFPEKEGNLILGLVESPFIKVNYENDVPRVVRWANINLIK
jgi:hypothetical protein